MKNCLPYNRLSDSKTNEIKKGTRPHTHESACAWNFSIKFNKLPTLKRNFLAVNGIFSVGNFRLV
jgi:hypothetical protein